MEMNFCRRCGERLAHVAAHVYSCTNGHTLFANASPACGIWFLNDANEVLVATRAQDPGKGAYDAPGGFNDGAETPEDGIKREIKEELGLSPVDYTEPEFLLHAMDTYEYQNEYIDVMSTMFVSRIKNGAKITPSDDVANAEFIPLNQIHLDSIFLPAPRAALGKLQEAVKNGDIVVKNK